MSVVILIAIVYFTMLMCLYTLRCVKILIWSLLMIILILVLIIAVFCVYSMIIYIKFPNHFPFISTINYKLTNFITDNFLRLEVSGPDITVAELVSSIKQSPCFKKLYIYDCENLGEVNVQDLPQLKQLEMISVSRTNIKITFLAEMIKKAINLSQINVVSCVGLDRCSLLVHFANVQIKREHRIASVRPEYIEFAKIIPIELLCLIDTFVSNELFDEVNILKKWFPEETMIIDSVICSKDFKNINIKYNHQLSKILGEEYSPRPNKLLLNAYNHNSRSSQIVASPSNSGCHYRKGITPC